MNLTEPGAIESDAPVECHSLAALPRVIIAVMPAPYDRETIERLATEVRPLLQKHLI